MKKLSHEIYIIIYIRRPAVAAETQTISWPPETPTVKVPLSSAVAPYATESFGVFPKRLHFEF